MSPARYHLEGPDRAQVTTGARANNTTPTGRRRQPPDPLDVTERTLGRPVTGVRNDHDLPTTNASTPRGGDRTVGSRRRAATEAHLRAITTINALFDRVDELIEARDRLTGVAPLGPDDDPIRDAEVLLQHVERLNQALAGVRSAAVDASVHRRRNDLAADVGTKVNLLFPRPGRDASTASTDDDEMVEPGYDGTATATGGHASAAGSPPASAHSAS
jgi:hypothetical protein